MVERSHLTGSKLHPVFVRNRVRNSVLESNLMGSLHLFDKCDILQGFLENKLGHILCI